LCWNIVKKSDREETLEMIPDDYKKIAVVFNVPEDELKKRLEKREKETGKHIPPEAIEKMKNCYTPPSKEEGFNKIINL
jgi:predicted kinase